MGKRSYSGGTTALVIVLTLVIILIGVGFFFWMKIIGGGNELQHATDSGNLNVAKQALKKPAVPLVGADEPNEFADLTDPDSNNQVDLLVYDRLVGKAVIVALNAASENTDDARQHAKSINDLVEGSNGVGSRLGCELAKNSNLEDFFTSLSNSNSTRMLENKTGVTSNASETGVAFMARTMASNVYIASNQVPSNVQNFLSNGSNVVLKNGRQYLAGYTGLQCGIPTTPQAVPMRPGEQPHIVAVNDFQKMTTPPSVNGSVIPPNAFRSGGIGLEANQTGQNLTTRSCAVVGTLNQDFAVSIPRGYILVDNTGVINNVNGTIGGGTTALSKALMQPHYIALVPGSPDVFGPDQSVQNLEDFVNSNDPSTPVPSNLLSAVASPSGLTSDQAYAALKSDTPPAVHNCNNLNTYMGSSGPVDQDCVNHYNAFLNYYNTQDPGSASSLNGLMAVEAFKCYVLQVRASAGSDGCGSATAPSSCTGLKAYNIHGTYGVPCNFAAAGTLTQLLSEVDGASSLGDAGSDFMTRLYQIHPTADANEIACVLGSTVAFGQVSYIYLQTATNPPSLTLSTAAPPFPTNVAAIPDGTTIPFSTPWVNLNGSIVNVSGIDGYDNPWDCPALPAEGQNSVQWTPGSGYNNVMGKLLFKNCASGGGNWCCPC